MSYYPEFKATFARFLGAIEGRRVVVIGHQRPDGDCIGSQVALVRVLRARGIDAIGVNPDSVPRRIKFLIGDTPFFQRDAIAHDGRTAVYTDCADHSRAGDRMKEIYPNAFACFDHHISNRGFAQHNLVDTASSATAELLTGLFLDAGIEIDATSAQALYTGIMTDTGQFRFASTTKRVFTIAGELLERGAEPARAGQELYERESLGKLKLLQHFITSLRLECDGRVCLGVLPAGIFEKTGASVEDTEGLVDYARSIDGVAIGALIEEREGVMKASLRAQCAEYRVDSIAAQFNGGGHACAAGLNFPDTLDNFYPKLVAACARRLVEVEQKVTK
ncbi:MAG: bifunctional oligoribonuclease/PAP phosphatase NrnA [Candidatus Didemnitutus sp.]|nr:bifunctional oligoribonuclease/PAP phosphatase NrnA [Candidatus Didemnitutus sp.]